MLISIININHFYYYSNNGVVTIPYGVRFINRNSLPIFHIIKSIYLPETVTYIAPNTFSDCIALTFIGVNSLQQYNTVISELNTEQIRQIRIATPHWLVWNQVLVGHTNQPYLSNIPNQVNYIGDFCFQYKTHLQSARIPKHIKKIGQFSFSYCTNLLSVHLPKNLTSIGIGAFRYCTHLTEITLPESIKQIEDFTFIGCTSLRKVVLPSQLTRIERSAFKGCTNLKTITLPNTVTLISAHAFSHCSQLTQINRPPSVQTISLAAFYKCRRLRIVTNSPSETKRLKNLLPQYCHKKITCYHKTHKKNLSCILKKQIAELNAKRNVLFKSSILGQLLFKDNIHCVLSFLSIIEIVNLNSINRQSRLQSIYRKISIISFKGPTPTEPPTPPIDPNFMVALRPTKTNRHSESYFKRLNRYKKRLYSVISTTSSAHPNKRTDNKRYRPNI